MIYKNVIDKLLGKQIYVKDNKKNIIITGKLINCAITRNDIILYITIEKRSPRLIEILIEIDDPSNYSLISYKEYQQQLLNSIIRDLWN